MLLFVARHAWGGAYGVLNLTNTAYAYGDGDRAGTRIGLNRAVSTIGPCWRSGLGGWLVTIVGPQYVFVIYGLIGLAAIPLALTLPRLRQPSAMRRPRQADAGRRAHSTCCSSSIALGADGVFTATLSTLLADIIPVTSALIGAGLLLAAQRLISVILSFASGPLIDRLEARRVLVPCGLVIAAGLSAIALGSHLYRRGRADLRARAFAIIAPVIAAQQSSDRIGAIAAYATWSDCGLAAGAFIGIVGMEWAGYRADLCAARRRDRRGDPVVHASRAKQFRRQRARDRALRAAAPRGRALRPPPARPQTSARCGSPDSRPGSRPRRAGGRRTA